MTWLHWNKKDNMGWLKSFLCVARWLRMEDVTRKDSTAQGLGEVFVYNNPRHQGGVMLRKIKKMGRFSKKLADYLYTSA